MPMSRVLKNSMRSAKSPVAGTSSTKPAGDAGGGKPNKQYTSPKVKNSAPNYLQKDPRTEGKSRGLK